MDLGLGRSLFENLVEKAKQGYFFFEDRYYGILDKINEHVPVYKAVDPIDRVVPSFIVFIALLLTVFVFFLLLAMPQAALLSTIRAVNERGNPLESVKVSVLLEGQKLELETDAFGETALSLPTSEVSADVVLSKEDFLELSKTVTLKANEVTEFVLSKRALSLQPKTYSIYLVDSVSQQLVKRPAEIRFSCSTGATPPSKVAGSSGEFKNIGISSVCGTLVANISAEGYEPVSSHPIKKDPTYVKLDPLNKTTEINVLVKDHLGLGVAGSSVKLFEDDLLSDQLVTDGSGTGLFENVGPGTYSITASHSDGRYAERTGIVVRPGMPQSIILSFEELVEGSKIFMHLLDVSTKGNVSDASIFIYSNDKLLYSTSSDFYGKAEQPVDGNLSFMAVIRHPDYLTKIVPEVWVLDASQETPQSINMARSTASNNGKAYVSVTDFEAQEPVEDATVFLFDSEFPKLVLNYPSGSTNADGNLFIENLPASTYFAKAKKGDTEGQSDEKQLSEGGLISLPVVLVLSEGGVEVTVLEKSTGLPIAGAEAKIFDFSNDELLESGQTDMDGVFVSRKFKSNKTVYVKASKESYLSEVSVPVPIIGKATQEISMHLASKSDIDPEKNIALSLEGVYEDLETERPASTIESGQRYYLKFGIALPKDANYSNLGHHLRVGPESQAQYPETLGHELFLARLLADQSRASPQASTIFSACYGPLDLFSNPCVSDSASKQANTLWQFPDPESSYTLVLKLETEQFLDDGTEIELRYKGKAVVDGQAFETEEFLKKFKIGETICTPKVDCPPIVWRFWLQGLEEEKQPITNFAEDEKIALLENTTYTLFYEARNTSGFDLTATLGISNKGPEGPVEISPGTGFSEKSFSADTVTETGSPAALKAVKEATLTKIVFLLSSTRGISSEKELFFAVEPAQELILEVVPSRLNPGDATQVITGTVKAPDGTPLQGANVNIYLPTSDPGQPRRLFQSIATDEEGFFKTAENFNLRAGLRVKVEATAPSFKKKTVSIPVKAGSFFDPRYECIEVPSEDGGIPIFEDVRPNETRAFVVENNCDLDAEIRFNTKLKTEPSSLTIAAGGKANVTVTAQEPEGGEKVYLGQYPVFLKAKLAGDVRFVSALKAMMIITDPDGSCFSINKTSFNLADSPEDSGIITNSCAVEFNDAWSPELALDSFKAIIERNDIEIPDLVYFPWGVKADIESGTPVAASGQQPTSEGWLELNIPTGTQTGTTIDEYITLDFGFEDLKNADSLQFEAIIHDRNCLPSEHFRDSYVNSNSITIASGGSKQQVSIPCSEQRCTWEESGCTYSVERCKSLHPCWRGTFEASISPAAESIESITIPVYNKDNEGFLFLNLHGEIINQNMQFDIGYEHTQLELGPQPNGRFNSAIFPVRNFGFVLGEINKSLTEKLGESVRGIIDVNYTVYSDNPDVEVWLVDDTVYGKYVGIDTDENPSETPFTIRNLFLNTTEYNLILVDDYVNHLKGGS